MSATSNAIFRQLSSTKLILGKTVILNKMKGFVLLLRLVKNMLAFYAEAGYNKNKYKSGVYQQSAPDLFEAVLCSLSGEERRHKIYLQTL